MPGQIREGTVVPGREGQEGLDFSQASEVGWGVVFPILASPSPGP